MNKEGLWQAVLAQIQFNTSPANFSTWFRNTEIFEKKEGVVLVSVPNSFSKEWLENKYHKVILKILHDLDGEIKDIKYFVGKTSAKIVPAKKEVLLPLDPQQLEFQEFQVNKETNLNPRYLFENFVVGSFNELPHAAATAVAKDPGLVYNPLFLYGGVGLGKTHLLQAVGNEITKSFPSKKVKYTSSEKFTSEVVAAIRNKKISELKEKYRLLDVLIIDDIQFLSGKEKTQEEFFHTFNALYEKNKQVILSSDRPPKAISALEERLRSRFEGGMIADIGYPDFETRLAILSLKLQERKISLPDDVVNHIASIIQKNIRELEGALNRLVVYQKLNNQTPTLENTKSLLENLINSPAKMVNPRKIIQTVAEFYDLRERDVIASSRKKEIVKPRQIAIYFLREELKCSYPFIGKKIGGKDHTTAIHGYEKIKKELGKDERLKEEISLIRQRIYG